AAFSSGWGTWSLFMTSPWPSLPCRGRQVVAHGAAPTWLAEPAPAKAGVKPHAAAWRPRQGNPCTHPFRGRVRLPASLRHHSVVDGRPLLRSSLVCAQTASGAGHAEASSRL